jgi:hypothetical protein
LFTLRPTDEAVDHHDQHQDQHGGGQQALHSDEGTASMKKIRPSAAGMNSPSTFRRESTTSRTKRRTGPLSRWQQVGVLACHHLLAAFGRFGPAGDAVGPCVIAGQLRPPISLRRRRASAASSGRVRPGPRLPWLRFGVGLPFGAVVPLASGGLASAAVGDVIAIRLVFLAAQQLHACQIICWTMTADRPPYARSPRLLRRQPHGRRGRRGDRARLATAAPTTN